MTRTNHSITNGTWTWTRYYFALVRRLTDSFNLTSEVTNYHLSYFKSMGHYDGTTSMENYYFILFISLFISLFITLSVNAFTYLMMASCKVTFLTMFLRNYLTSVYCKRYPFSDTIIYICRVTLPHL